MLETSGKDKGYFDWLHSLLELFDEKSIGDQLYKSGWIDRFGRILHPHGGAAPSRPLIGSRELHLWTPRYRRWPFGLPRSLNPESDGEP